jgi:hypothetical protein
MELTCYSVWCLVRWGDRLCVERSHLTVQDGPGSALFGFHLIGAVKGVVEADDVQA